MEYENDTLDDYSSSSERYRTRHVNIRTLRVEPQFNFDETYITISPNVGYTILTGIYITIP